MRYLRVRWLHDHSDEPVELFSELDDQSWERRKVELFPDGSMGFAEDGEASETTRLGVELFPPFDEIAADPQFQPEWASAKAFELIWQAAHQRVGAHR